MNVTGIIAEYNPFHRGHKYQINYCRKELQADYVIVVMSGDYVQRGTPALLPKHLRAENGTSMRCRSCTWNAGVRKYCQCRDICHGRCFHTGQSACRWPALLWKWIWWSFCTTGTCCCPCKRTQRIPCTSEIFFWAKGCLSPLPEARRWSNISKILIILRETILMVFWRHFSIKSYGF